jgi:Dockerin type I domain
MITKLTAIATVSVALLGLSGAHADVPFQPIADLGFGASVYDVNAAGSIVGIVRTSSGLNVPAVWSSATATPTALPTDGRGGFASAINSNGEVVGQTFSASGSGGTPTVWRGGVRVQLPDLGGGGDARDIGESGEIVGYVYGDGGALRAARWVKDVLEVLPIPAFGNPGDSVWSSAESINSSGIITGTVRVAWDSTGQAGSDSLAIRWDNGAVRACTSQGLETKGLSVDNLGNILLNGYFTATGGPAVARADGTLVQLPLIGSSYVVRATAMSRSGIVCGYYLGSDPTTGRPLWKGAAWSNGTATTAATALQLPTGMAWAFPWGVGNNGVVIGEVSDGVSGIAIPGYWALDLAPAMLTASDTSGARGQVVELAATSMRGTAKNVGHSVSVTVNGIAAGQAVTNANGVAKIAFTIPANVSGSQLSVRFRDESGAIANKQITVSGGCAMGDLNCDGAVNGTDLGLLMSQWGSSGSADLNGDGVVNGTDLGRLIGAWRN